MLLYALAHHAAKHAVEMVWRETGDGGQFFERQRLVEMPFDVRDYARHSLLIRLQRAGFHVSRVGCPHRLILTFFADLHYERAAYPAGQTLGQTASFRQTAPETWCQSRVCGAFPASFPKTVKHPLCKIETLPRNGADGLQTVVGAQQFG